MGGKNRGSGFSFAVSTIVLSHILCKVGSLYRILHFFYGILHAIIKVVDIYIYFNALPSVRVVSFGRNINHITTLCGA
jgi:hypothetical protein